MGSIDEVLVLDPLYVQLNGDAEPREVLGLAHVDLCVDLRVASGFGSFSALPCDRSQSVQEANCTDYYQLPESGLLPGDMPYQNSPWPKAGQRSGCRGYPRRTQACPIAVPGCRS